MQQEFKPNKKLINFERQHIEWVQELADRKFKGNFSRAMRYVTTEYFAKGKGDKNA